MFSAYQVQICVFMFNDSLREDILHRDIGQREGEREAHGNPSEGSVRNQNILFKTILIAILHSVRGVVLPHVTVSLCLKQHVPCWLS